MRVHKIIWSVLGLQFGFILGANIDVFLCYFLASFFDGLLEASGCILGSILVDCWRSFLVLFPTLRKQPHPTNLLQIAVRSRVGGLKRRGNTIQKVSKNPFQN